MPYPLSTISQIINAKYTGGDDATFEHISIDTRTLQPGDLYIAIIGEHLDGHDFIKAAEEKKAGAMIVSKPVQTTLPTLRVEDTTKALGQLAAYHRNQFNIPTIGITGSCGKTTARSLIANILQQADTTLSSQKSFNNAIGVPLTL